MYNMYQNSNELETHNYTNIFMHYLSARSASENTRYQ